MAIHQSVLFNWDNVQNLPDLQRLKFVLDALPDEPVIELLEQSRGRGRNDYPVAAMWRLYIAGIVLQHASAESLIREANRNPRLLEICGFEALPRQSAPKCSIVTDPVTGRTIPKVEHQRCRSPIPNGWNMSRFLDKLMALDKQHKFLETMKLRLREALLEQLDDFGECQGYDGKAIESHSTGRVNRKTGQTSDPDADWGTKKYHGVDARTGKRWEQTKSWFGYELHLIADANYEIPIDWKLTKASKGEAPVLRKRLRKLFETTPELAARGRYFVADRGLDGNQLPAMLLDEFHIRPLIDQCQKWRAEKQDINYDPSQPITRSLYPERIDTIVYDENGRLHCHCPKTNECRPMVYDGYETKRGSLKFRCPAAVYEFECQGRQQCLENAGSKAGRYGRVVRVKMNDHPRRIFTPSPKGTRTWNEVYAKRSALERVFSRLDQAYGLDHHYIRGKARMKLRVSLSMLTMMALALAHVKHGQPEQMRSLLQHTHFRKAA